MVSSEVTKSYQINYVAHQRFSLVSFFSDNQETLLAVKILIR